MVSRPALRDEAGLCTEGSLYCSLVQYLLNMVGSGHGPTSETYRASAAGRRKSFFFGGIFEDMSKVETVQYFSMLLLNVNPVSPGQHHCLCLQNESTCLFAIFNIPFHIYIYNNALCLF